MKEKEPSTVRNFEMDSLVIFERLLQGYNKAKQTPIWNSNLEILVDKLTHIPSAPFPQKLIELFNFEYLVLSKDINEIIAKSLIIRKEMEEDIPSIQVNQNFYSGFFIPAKTYPKRIDIYNYDGELCCIITGKIRLKLIKLLMSMIPWNGIKLKDSIRYKEKVTTIKKLEIFYYSEFIDLTTTSKEDYYHFFCDYYAKIKLLNFVSNNKNLITQDKSSLSTNHFNIKSFENVLNLSPAQQVLWAYFIFKILGFNIRKNASVASLIKFLHIINQKSLDDYRNSYYYKLVMKAPYIKNDNSLLTDLKIVLELFKNRGIPTKDIEHEIFNITMKLRQSD